MMKKCYRTISLACLFLMATSVSAAILSEEERQEQIRIVQALLANEVRPIESELLERGVRPFSPDRGAVLVEKVEAREVLTDEQRLRALSEYISPTGIFLFGGEFYLIFKENKKKVGSKVGVFYDGVEYEVTIADITSTTYTVKLGDSELQLKLK